MTAVLPVFLLNQVNRKGQVHPARSIFNPSSEAERQRLLGLEAARELTDDERSLFSIFDPAEAEAAAAKAEADAAAAKAEADAAAAKAEADAAAAKAEVAPKVKAKTGAAATKVAKAEADIDSPLV